METKRESCSRNYTTRWVLLSVHRCMYHVYICICNYVPRLPRKKTQLVARPDSVSSEARLAAQYLSVHSQNFDTTLVASLNLLSATIMLYVSRPNIENTLACARAACPHCLYGPGLLLAATTPSISP